MSRRATPRCALCFETVPYDGPTILRIALDEPACAVTLRWHIACATTDPLSAEFAEAVHAEKPAAGEDDPLTDVYRRIVARAAESEDVDRLRGVVDVRRDIDDPRRTMRGPGLLWGLPAARVRPA